MGGQTHAGQLGPSEMSFPPRQTTAAYERYWQFAANRQAQYLKRIAEPDAAPWTDDPILSTYRFTNAFRALDRVSQYLIREVQYNPARSSATDELFFRTLLFKLFNKIEVWEALEAKFGPMQWNQPNSDFLALSEFLDDMRARKETIYSAAYIMPSPPMGYPGKHRNHLALLSRMMFDGLPAKVEAAKTMQRVYELLLGYDGIGPFLAFQYALDINYTPICEFSEAEFVVAGPGAHDGMSKCFGQQFTPAEAAKVCALMYEYQESEFARLGLTFPGLYGRPLQFNDCQGLFCETSKYTRISDPDIRGTNDRAKIKQNYKPFGKPLPLPFFPPRWGINEAVPALVVVKRDGWGKPI